MVEHVTLIRASSMGVLGVVPVILGFLGAESQPVVRYDGTTCVYDIMPAQLYGTIGALFLLAEHVVIRAAIGCCRTRKDLPDYKRVLAVVMSVFSWYPTILMESWIMLVFAEGLFLVGAWWNYYKGDCYVRQQGWVFAIAALLSIFLCVFGITTFLLLQTSPSLPESTQQQLPEVATGPGYVHLQG